MIHVCVPVLRRYDLLRNLVKSLESSTVPYEVHVLDNGRNQDKAIAALDGLGGEIITPVRQLGVAESWNWFIRNIPEHRVITNDDVIFAPDSLELMAATTNDITWAREAGFSCFIIRDTCVEKIGLFDEAISPGYGYYEDQDYAQRINRRGKGPEYATSGDVACHVEHLHSKTLETYSRAEMNDHHRKFRLAQTNYIRKWGLEAEFQVQAELPRR